MFKDEKACNKRDSIRDNNNRTYTSSVSGIWLEMLKYLENFFLDHYYFWMQ